ncbi:MAG: arylmalonate decarboxylase [Azospirillaceae bacterium]|nr:arylmalonate decarboxylase [Azospirillaceae bacterium]
MTIARKDRYVPGRDAQGWRLKLGVLGPSTNTTVQPDMEAMRPYGVTNHYSRIIVDDAQAVSDETFRMGTTLISDNTIDAVKGVLTCKPDYLVMGMSAITFYGGQKGSEAFQQRIRDVTDVGASIGSESVAAALRAYGGIKRVAFVSPYFPTANREVTRFLGDNGFDVVRDTPLQCPSWTAIAQVQEPELREVLKKLDGDDVDAIVQVGTNLSMVRLAAAAELWLGKPVIAINTATYWHALRACGIQDKIFGLGRLLEEF